MPVNSLKSPVDFLALANATDEHQGADNIGFENQSVADFLRNLTSGTPVSDVRQTVQYTASQAQSYTFIWTTSSFNIGINGAPLIISFAQGTDNFTSLLEDAVALSNIMSLNKPFQQYFIYADYVSPTSVIWGNTFALPRYSYNPYRPGIQSLLRFDPSVPSVLDDFGIMWTKLGTGVVCQNTESKFGDGALGGSGSGNSLNGVDEYITRPMNSFRSPFMEEDFTQDNGWSVRCWVYITSQTTNESVIFSTVNVTGRGLGLTCKDDGTGQTTLTVYYSSDGTTEIAGSGISFPSFTNGWHFVEITYDYKLGPASTLRFYVDGVPAIAYTSVGNITKDLNIFQVGGGIYDGTSTGFLAGYIDKLEILPYCDHPNNITYTPPTSPPTITAPNYAADYFSIQQMVMYKVTGPALLPGTLPELTPIKRVYIGEAITGALGIATPSPYATNGRASPSHGLLNNPGGAAIFHAMGHKFVKIRAELKINSDVFGWPAGTVFPVYNENFSTADGFIIGNVSRLLAFYLKNATGGSTNSGFVIQGATINFGGSISPAPGGMIPGGFATLLTTVERTF